MKTEAGNGKRAAVSCGWLVIGLLVGLALPAPAQNTRAVMADTNGVIVAPANFKEANAPWCAGVAEALPWPVFQLDMGVWTEFEIKASTNNFASLLYYFQTNLTNSIADDPQPRVYFTDSSATDPRCWRLSSNHVSIVSQLANPTNALVGVVFFPSRTVVNNGVTNSSAAWCSMTNSNLVWSWTRLDALDYERDASGRPVWRPIGPNWKPSRLSP